MFAPVPEPRKVLLYCRSKTTVPKSTLNGLAIHVHLAFLLGHPSSFKTTHLVLFTSVVALKLIPPPCASLGISNAINFTFPLNPSIPLSVTCLSNLIPFATGNFSAFTRRLLLRRRQVNCGCVIMAAVNCPKAASSAMLKVVFWLIVARLLFAVRAVRVIVPRGISVVELTTQET